MLRMRWVRRASSVGVLALFALGASSAVRAEDLLVRPAEVNGLSMVGGLEENAAKPIAPRGDTSPAGVDVGELGPNPSVAKPAAPASPALQANAPDELDKLGYAERLTVKFPRYEQLSGDYRVGADGTMSIPGLGRINVTSLTIADLRRELAELVLKAGGGETDTSIEIAEYRPIYVTGFVRNPGSYPWKPGMAVLHAETLSGGLLRPAGSVSELGLGNEVVRQRKAKTDLSRDLAALARLEAEQKSASIIEVPPRLVDLVGAAEAADLINSQSSALRARQSSVESQTASLEYGLKLTRLEIEGLTKQLDRLKEHLVERRGVVTEIANLLDKKLVTRSRLLEEESKVSDLEEKEANLSVGIVRANGILLASQRDLDNLHRDQRSNLDGEIFKLERDTAQLEIDLEGANTAKKQLLQVSGNTNPDNAPKVRYELFRSADHQSKTVPADRFTALRPGDVVVVIAAGNENAGVGIDASIPQTVQQASESGLPILPSPNLLNIGSN